MRPPTGGATAVPGLRDTPASARLEPFVVELDRFHGPLHLLLHLIRSQDLDIFDIPIARITEQFRRAIETGLEGMPLERAGEFLELAATLVRIKAQLLLPRPGELEWEEDPRAELVRRLLEYEFFQEVARVLSAAEADRRRHLAKGYVEPRRPPAACVQELRVTTEEFLAAARAVPVPAAGPPPRPPSLLVTVEEKIALIRRLLGRARRLAFEKLFASWRARPHVVAALLAALELARQQVVRIEQAGRFGSIWLLPGPRARGGKEAGGGARASGSAEGSEGEGADLPGRDGNP